MTSQSLANGGRALASLLALWLVTACSSAPRVDNKGLVGHPLQDLQADMPCSDSTSPPVVAIALGGGGLRGYAHIGVLQALQDAGIRPDIVVGTSIGALIGAAYAAGASPAELWRQATSASPLSLADVTLFGPGFIKGNALARWTNELVAHRLIEQFPMRFVAVASDLERAAPIAISSGDAGQAVRASAAIPGVFLPVKYADGELVDGGVTALVPIEIARALGADIVIGVDIYCHGAKYPTDSVLSTLLRVSQAQSCLIADAELANADVVIAPAVTAAPLNDAAARTQARDLGYEAGLAAVPVIRALQQQQESIKAERRGADASAHWHRELAVSASAGRQCHEALKIGSSPAFGVMVDDDLRHGGQQ